MMHRPLFEIYSDGGSRGNPGHGASAFIVYKDKTVLFQRGYFLRRTTNNIAEYFAVLMAMAWLSKNLNVVTSGEINFYLDSELVVNQLNGLFKIKNEKLKSIYKKIEAFQIGMGEIKTKFHYIPREGNLAADALVNKTVDENI
jgi:ribonuclease HI